MCDEIDAAAELELLNVEIALKNRQRADHKKENRSQPNGKQF